MVYSLRNFSFKTIADKIDWKLLLFLMLFLDVKLAVKIPALILIYLLRFNFRFNFSLKNSRLPLFYLVIIGVSFISLLVNQSYHSANYLPLFFMGIIFWALCLLAIHQVKLSVETNSAEALHRTVLVFFIINLAFSFFNIAHIIWETGAINPYRYQGEYQKYFIGTGDYIRGLTFDTSTTNAVLNAFGVVYFLSRKNWVMVLACMAVLLLTGSNFTNLALMAVLGLLFIFRSTKDQKSIIVVCLMFLVVFMAKVSPQNNMYAYETFKNAIEPPKVVAPPPVADETKVNQVLSPEDSRRAFAKKYLDSIKNARNKMAMAPAKPAAPIPSVGQGRIIVPGPDINTPPYQTPIDTSAEQRQLLAFIDHHESELPISSKNTFSWGLPGKGIAMLQTVAFLRHNPVKIAAGDGLGNFSSKLAFKATGLGLEGGYPSKFVFINKDFIMNHLDVYLNFFSKRAELHSLTNSPFSVYDQLLAEYGLLGLAAFVLFYIWFFARHYKKLTYGLPLLMLMLAVFFIDYWFEQLSVIVFFELLLLLNIKETLPSSPINYVPSRA